MTLCAGPPPNPARNLTVWQTKDGLHIAWEPPSYTPVAIHQYLIEYKTVGQWVPLGETHPAETTKYTWKTVSRGALYNFRLVSISSTGAHSEPSRVVSFTTTGTPTWQFAFVRDQLMHFQIAFYVSLRL